MKRFFKILLIVLCVLLVPIIGFALYVQIRGIPKYEPKKVELTVDVTPARVENGARIGSMLCASCHSDENNRFVGKQMKDVPKEFGTIYSRNITQDATYGIGNWTDGELYYFLRTGVRPDGQYIPVYMPKFPQMADEDLKDIIAWLRSDHPSVQATQTEAPPAEPSFLVKLLANTVWEPMPFPEKPIPRPDTTNKVALGKYYANAVVGCYHCHSDDFKTVDYVTPEKSEGFYGGGNPMLDLEGDIVPSTNLTFDESGLADYSEAEFIKAVRFGQKPDGTPLEYPMVPLPSLTDKEVGAIYSYLQTVPKIKNGY